MSVEQLAFLISRTFALSYVFYLLSFIIGLAAGFGSWQPLALMFSGVNILTHTIAAAIFWFWAPVIAKKLVPSTNKEDKKILDVTVLDMQKIAIIVVGFMFLIKAVPQISQLILIGLQKIIIPDMPFRFSPSETWSSSIEATLYLGAGLFLIFGATGISGFIHKARGRE